MIFSMNVNDQRVLKAYFERWVLPLDAGLGALASDDPVAYYRLVMDDPKDKRKIYKKICRAYMAAREFYKALAVAEEYTRICPNFAGGWVYYGQIKDELGEHDAALEAAEYALQLNPHIHWAKGRLDLPDVDGDIRNRAIELKQGHRPQEALDLLEDRIGEIRDANLLPNSKMLFDAALLKLDLYGLNDFREIKYFLEQALEVDPSDFRCLLLLGDIHRDAGHIDEAIYYYRLSAEYNLNPWVSYGKIISMLLDNEYFEDAVYFARERVDLYPYEEDGWKVYDKCLQALKFAGLSDEFDRYRFARDFYL